MNYLKVIFIFIILNCGFALKYSSAQKRPNVLLIMTDDQGLGDIGLHNNDVLKTPNMDAIAQQGAEFKHFIVNFNCSPTRASMLTGRDNYRTGVVGVTQTSPLMKSSEITIAKLLSDAGYSTGIFGKWHLGDSYPMRPSDKGFQETLIHKGGGIGQASDPPGNSYFNPILEHNNVKKTFEGYCDDIFADATLNFIEKNKDKPFFAYYATNLPHFPLTVSDKWADPYRKLGLHELNALTYGMIANVDANIGRLLDKLKALGIEDNTIVIFIVFIFCPSSTSTSHTSFVSIFVVSKVKYSFIITINHFNNFTVFIVKTFPFLFHNFIFFNYKINIRKKYIKSKFLL
jgi:arylsulfatase/arylsulfatase A